ncbi:MAG: PEP-CTERM sorting domain-containing protein [Acidobacteriota bacterium]
MNRLRILPVYGLIVIALISAFAGWSLATTIDFETLTGTNPSSFLDAYLSPGPGPQIITIGNATFAGGIILEDTVNLSADYTVVYGTSDYIDNTLQNPLTVSFASNITNFFLDVYNGELVPVTYKVSDNAGHIATFILPPNTVSGNTTIGFAAAGDKVTIEATAISGTPSFDFFIDNIHFNEPLPPALDDPSPVVPEPASLLLLGTGLCAIGFTIRRRKK